MEHTMIVCEMLECVHNLESGRCSCTTIGIERMSEPNEQIAVCSSYFKTPDVIKARLIELSKGEGGE